MRNLVVNKQQFIMNMNTKQLVAYVRTETADKVVGFQLFSNYRWELPELDELDFRRLYDALPIDHRLDVPNVFRPIHVTERRKGVFHEVQVMKDDGIVVIFMADNGGTGMAPKAFFYQHYQPIHVPDFG